MHPFIRTKSKRFEHNYFVKVEGLRKYQTETRLLKSE